jgi:tRNA-Thr(GGU) m(6)t(6)A37 methyltransferase TsaA
MPSSWLLLVVAHIRPIGHIETIFRTKFGIPRQGCLAPDARAKLTLDGDAVGGDAASALSGLGEYSHVWLIWGFHLHADAPTRSKIAPPVLRGRKTGVFATRAPYRPNPFGLSLVGLDGVDGGTLHLSGVDLVDGSPVYDIKPYLAEWDAPRTAGVLRAMSEPISSLDVGKRPLKVLVTEAAREAIGMEMEGRRVAGREALVMDAAQWERVLGQCLAADPRPTYRWRKQQREGVAAEYDLCVDSLCARCCFETDGSVTVLSVRPDGAPS